MQADASIADTKKGGGYHGWCCGGVEPGLALLPPTGTAQDVHHPTPFPLLSCVSLTRPTIDHTYPNTTAQEPLHQAPLRGGHGVRHHVAYIHMHEGVGWGSMLLLLVLHRARRAQLDARPLGGGPNPLPCFLGGYRLDRLTTGPRFPLFHQTQNRATGSST